MSNQDKALIVIAATALLVGGAGYVRWQDTRFLDVAQSIDACDDEPTVQRKTSTLGAPATDVRQADARVVSWRRNGKLLTVSFVTPRSARLVVGSVTVTHERWEDPSRDPHQRYLYEDASGLRDCR